MEQIKVTTNYDLFSFMSGNRDIAKKNMLVRSIKKMDLTEYKPIIVNESYVIIDGQHRFMACKELEKPIYYMILHDTDEDEALIILNAYQKMWKEKDYLKFYTKRVGGRYNLLDEFEKKYNIGISNTMLILPEQHINSQILKSGNINFDINKDAEQIAEFITSDEISVLRFSKTRPFVLAVRKAFRLYSKRQISKIHRNALKIPHCADYTQYLTVFENIIK